MNKKGQGFHQFSIGTDGMIFVIGVIVGIIIAAYLSNSGMFDLSVLPFG